MSAVDRREFGGRFSVKENTQRLANYRYLEVQLMEMLGGWSHTTPQIAFKATFGYHVYDHAQAADLLGERLEQLRSGREREELLRWGRTAVARIEGFYNDNPNMPERDVHFTFLKPDNSEVVVSPSNIIGE